MTFKLVGFLVPSHTAKTFKIMYELEELRIIVLRLKFSRSRNVFLGLTQRNRLHDSIHSLPTFPVEISQFVNAYSPERKSPSEILNSIPLADPKKLVERETY